MLSFKRFPKALGEPTVRLARNEDSAAIRAFMVAVRAEFGVVVPPHLDSELDDLARSFADRGGTFWIWENDGEIVGTMALFARDARTCELRKFYFGKELRGNGRGRAAMKALMQFARRARFREMYVDIDFRFRIANRLYRRLGFRKVKSSQAPFAAQHDYLVRYRFH